MIAGRYRLGSDVGIGGMARVVGADDDRLARRVAIKLVPTDAVDPLLRERFRREARSSAGFSHPNAVATYDAGESDGYLYLVMELVDGPSLAQRLATEPRLPVHEAVRITDGVLSALQAAHAAGIVHRDIKPSNVLLGRHDHVKLADFGIAKRLDDLSSELTGTGRFVGTPKYLAPEQLEADPTTPASDLYSVGVVLYEMLAGRPPFDGATPLATALAHRTAPVPDLSAVRPDVPPHIAAVIARAMAKDPSDRFPTAASMRVALSGATAATTTRLLAPPMRPTEVIPVPPPVATTTVAPVHRAEQRRPQRWWLIPAVVLVAIGIAAFAVGSREDDGSSPATSALSAAAAPAAVETTALAPAPSPVTAAPTTAPPQTQQPATTVPPNIVPPVEELPTTPETVEELIEVLDGNPDIFGPRTGDLRNELDQFRGRGDGQRARQLLERVGAWARDGEFTIEGLGIVVQLVAPIAVTGSDDGGEGGDGEG